VKSWILITPHQGLGDHLLCNGIYREYSRKFRKVFISVRRNYFVELSSLLGDINNVTLIPLPINHLWRNTLLLQKMARFMRIKVLGLGGYGENFLETDIRFDCNFYEQAGINFECRWSAFTYPRSFRKEEELFDLLKCAESPYLFIHEDHSRGFSIKRELLPRGLRVVSTIASPNDFNLVDYRKVIEGASEIHVIESAFAAFIESLPIDKPLYAHRYARPESTSDYRQEFTYKKLWKVISD